MPAPAIIVVGPTASGKSELALRLAETFNGVVINADSMQIYRELPILTACPGPEDTARAPHRLYGVLSGAERCSAGRWRTLALAECAAAAARNQLPILTGGTGLYVKALTEGIAPVPDVPADIRTAAAERLAEIGHAAFHAALAEIDPQSAARIPVGNTQRLIRAWEVWQATGKPLSYWHALPTDGPPPQWRFRTLCLRPPRDVLYARCTRRFDAMIAAGALAEVAALAGHDLPTDAPIRKAVGVRALSAHLAGTLSLADAVAAASRETRRYAKRQLTWFRHQLADAEILPAQYSERLWSDVGNDIRRYLLTAAK